MSTAVSALASPLAARPALHGPVSRWGWALRGAALPAALLAFWYAAVYWELWDAALLERPDTVLVDGLAQLFAGAFALDLAASLARDLSGFAIGSLAGLLLGGLLGASQALDRLVSPSLHTVKHIALFAWIPLISMLLGIGEPAKIAFIALAAFYPVAIHTLEGIRSVPRSLDEVARVLELGRWQRLRQLVIPAASAEVFAGLRLALICSWIATIGAEYFLLTGHGVGATLIQGRQQFDMGSVIFGLAVIGSIGALLQRAAARLEARGLRWRSGER
jgi:sulfonate transport system permease protein